MISDFWTGVLATVGVYIVWRIIRRVTRRRMRREFGGNWLVG